MSKPIEPGCLALIAGGCDAPTDGPGLETPGLIVTVECSTTVEDAMLRDLSWAPACGHQLWTVFHADFGYCDVTECALLRIDDFDPTADDECEDEEQPREVEA